MLSNEDLFEGDLKLSKEMIVKFYNFNSIPGGEKLLQKYIDQMNITEKANTTNRAAVRDAEIYLWPRNEVRY